MTDNEFVRTAFKNLGDNVLTLASEIRTLARETADTRVELAVTRSEMAAFQRQVLNHFDTCPVDELREHTGQVDVAVQRLKDHVEKRSVAPKQKPFFISDRTIGLFLIFLITVLAAVGVTVNL